VGLASALSRMGPWALLSFVEENHGRDVRSLGLRGTQGRAGCLPRRAGANDTADLVLPTKAPLSMTLSTFELGDAT
jgi:hypothetical protein